LLFVLFFAISSLGKKGESNQNQKKKKKSHQLSHFSRSTKHDGLMDWW